MHRLWIIAIMVVGLWSCQVDPLEGLVEDEIVVHAVLKQFADTQLISLSRVTPLGSDPIQTFVEHASVSVTWSDSTYIFEAKPGFLGQYFNTELPIESNRLYSLEVNSDGQIVESLALSPPAISVNSSALDDISVDPENTGNTVLAIDWIPSEDHPVVLDLLVSEDALGTPINYPDENGGYFEENYEFPIYAGGVNFLDYDFTHFGNQVIRFYRINEEYTDLLKYPLNNLTFNELSFQDNIINGSGFFAVVTIDQLSFIVLEE